MYIQFPVVCVCAGDANSYVEHARKIPVPHFLPTNANFMHDVGDTAVLECAVENLGGKQVSMFLLFVS